MPEHDSPGSRSTERAAARRLIETFWERLLVFEPLLATHVGDPRYDDVLPDPSEEGLAERDSYYRCALESSENMDRRGLDRIERTSLDILEETCRREIASIHHRFDRFGAVSHIWGPAQLLIELASIQPTSTPEQVERYVARLRGVPRYMDEVTRVVGGATASPQRAPKLVVERTIGQVERLLAIPAESSPSAMSIPEEVDGARQTAVELLRDDVYPAYSRYLDALRGYLPHATGTIGLSALDGGAEMYAAQIESWTTVALEPEAVHRMGIEALARIQEERSEVAGSLRFGDAGAAIASLGEGAFARTPEEMVEIATRQVSLGWRAAADYFSRLPQAECEVRAVEPFREKDMPMAFYQSPSEGGERPGVYYVNTYDLPSKATYKLASITFHEANPGHHFQLTIEQEIPDRPKLRRFGGMLSGSSFIEGWGLYSERLADEMGLYADEWERLGMLEAQAFRAARLIVDTGIHALGWTRETSIAKLLEAGTPVTDAEIETDRYITMPAQALCYKVGQTEIERWRSEAIQRKGSAFSLKDFHDRLLALGSLPLPSLERELAID
jgi:uncharacterized protein (DUF885 family)